MRKSCFDCVVKHLGSAGVFVKETKMGYPDYDIWVIGELEHAADESLEEHSELAAVIREHRLAWMSDHRHRIPFEEMNRYVKACVMSKDEGIPYPCVPDELLDGISDGDGKLVTHGDTRP